MSIDLYWASVPVFTQALENLAGVIKKGKEDCAQKGYPEEALIHFRLAPDMLPFAKQIQIAADACKLFVARTSGEKAPFHEDNEGTFDELLQRIHSTLAFIQTIKPESMVGKEESPITFTTGGKEITLKAGDYLRFRTLPNLFFHSTTAYAILRHNGVTLGKRDFIGESPKT